MNEKLREKLAEWAGFQWLEATDGNYHWFDANGDIVSPTDEGGNAIWDMNACFELLVPKLYHYFIGDSVDGHASAVWNQNCSYGAKGETPALALCKAIEKLIDGEE